MAAKIKEFANATVAAAAMDDDDVDECKKENDEENDDDVYEVLPSVTKGEKRLDSALEGIKKLWKTIVDSW